MYTRRYVLSLGQRKIIKVQNSVAVFPGKLQCLIDNLKPLGLATWSIQTYLLYFRQLMI